MEEETFKNYFKNNPEYHFSVLKGLEELRVNNKKDIRQSQIEAMQAGNKVLSDLNKYLFTFSSVLIPIIFSLVSLDKMREKLSKQDSDLIVISLIFLLSSVLAGFVHMISELAFFKEWLENSEKKLKLCSSISFWPGAPLREHIIKDINQYEALKVELDKIELEATKESSYRFLILQGLFWFTGLLLLAIVIVHLLPYSLRLSF